MIVMDDASCMVDVARYFTEFCMHESDGASPCRAGTVQAFRILDRMTHGRATAADLERLEALCPYMQQASLCGLGQNAPTRCSPRCATSARSTWRTCTTGSARRSLPDGRDGRDGRGALEAPGGHPHDHGPAGAPVRRLPSAATANTITLTVDAPRQRPPGRRLAARPPRARRGRPHAVRPRRRLRRGGVPAVPGGGGGPARPQAACVTAKRRMVVQSDTERLRSLRRTTVELLLAEHLAASASASPTATASCRTWPWPPEVDHVGQEYQPPTGLAVDLLPPRFGVDHNRCVLCTRCVRVCDEVEGAHTWDVAGRGRGRG